MKAKVSETGLEATPVNPYEISNVVPMVGLNNFESYHTFEAANKSYPLTEYQEPGSVIECEDELVWQFYNNIKEYGVVKGWTNCTENNPSLAEDFSMKTRQALKPIPQPEKVLINPNDIKPPTDSFMYAHVPEKVKDETVEDKIKRRLESGDYDITDVILRQHQATIDKVVALIKTVQFDLINNIHNISDEAMVLKYEFSYPVLEEFLTKIKTLTP